MLRKYHLVVSLIISVFVVSCTSIRKVHYIPSDKIQEYFYDIDPFSKVVFIEKGHTDPIVINAYRYESIMLFIHDIDRFTEGSKLEVNSDLVSCVYNFEAHMRFISTQKVTGTVEIIEFNRNSNTYRLKVDLDIDEPLEKYHSNFKGKYTVRYIENPDDKYKVQKYINEEIL